MCTRVGACELDSFFEVFLAFLSVVPMLDKIPNTKAPVSDHYVVVCFVPLTILMKCSTLVSLPLPSLAQGKVETGGT